MMLLRVVVVVVGRALMKMKTMCRSVQGLSVRTTSWVVIVVCLQPYI
jgi:hypothetical protein